MGDKLKSLTKELKSGRSRHQLGYRSGIELGIGHKRNNYTVGAQFSDDHAHACGRAFPRRYKAFYSLGQGRIRLFFRIHGSGGGNRDAQYQEKIFHGIAPFLLLNPVSITYFLPINKVALLGERGRIVYV
jgi:hypothetical protein